MDKNKRKAVRIEIEFGSDMGRVACYVPSTIMGFDLGAPINTVLLLVIAYYAQRIVFPPISQPSETPDEFKKNYSWMPKSHPPTVLFLKYTPKTLVQYDGRNGQRILLAINRKVFDVTAGRNFYGPGMFEHDATKTA